MYRHISYQCILHDNLITAMAQY